MKKLYPKGKIVFIYNDVANIKYTYIEVAKRASKAEVLVFQYSEDFEEWKQKEDPKDIKFIFLGTYFPGDGRPEIKSGYFRGLEFYRDDIVSNKFYDKIPIIITSTMMRSETEAEKYLNEYKVSLRDIDEFHDIMYFGCDDLGRKIEELELN
jgi:hypothetical protein